MVMTPQKVLNKLKWTNGLDARTEVWFIHRGAPGDMKIIGGDEIRELRRSFFETEEASIPYHRVLKIMHEGEVIFEKGKHLKFHSPF